MDTFKEWLMRPFEQQFGTVVLACLFIGFCFFIAVAFFKIVRPRRVTLPGGATAELDDRDSPSHKHNNDFDDEDGAPSLKHHRFFKLMEAAKNPAFLLTNGGPITAKEVINLAFLRDCKFKVFREGIFDFVSDLERHEGDGIGKLPGVINDLVEKYERMSRTIEIMLPNGRVLCGVPKCYMQKFNSWHHPHTRLCLDGINGVLSDRIYPDWWTRTAAALEYLYMAFEMTREDANRTLAQLNGDLDREIAEMLCRDDDHHFGK